MSDINIIKALVISTISMYMGIYQRELWKRELTDNWNNFIRPSKLIGRMRTPVREAFSYEIRHGIRLIHCDSMKHKVILHWITMNMPYAVPYPVWKCLPYGSMHPPYCCKKLTIFNILFDYDFFKINLLIPRISSLKFNAGDIYEINNLVSYTWLEC